MGTAVTQQPPVPLRQANQVQAMGDEDVEKEVVPEEAVTKDVADEADTSTDQHTYHQSGISLYGLIWGQCSPAVQSELEGDPEYITKYPT